MFKIIIYCDHTDHLIGLRLCRALSQYGGVLYFHAGDISEFSIGSPTFIVYETDQIDSIQMDGAILVLCQNQRNEKLNITSSCNITCVVSSENTKALHMLLPLSVPAVTYGLSHKDSITISSIGQNDAVISIQRELLLQNGDSLDPCEFKVTNIRERNDEDILLSSSILILCHQFDDDNIIHL